MAIYTCDDCGGNVSTSAPACPHCGRTADLAKPAAPAKAPGMLTRERGCADLVLIWLFGPIILLGLGFLILTNCR